MTTEAAPTGDVDPTTAFDRLHRRVQRWVWDQRWDRLRTVQAHAVGPILADRDLVIAAATASGKTEAAWLPICSKIAESADTGAAQPGVKALYVGPLKALINDQHLRLEALGELADIPVHRWHGDVPASRKRALLRNPDGILLITPESLEALLVREGHRVGTVFAGLRYIVIDEMHSFIGIERGAQLQSLLHRLDLAVRRRVPRVGLSATLADLDVAADFLRPGHRSQVHRLDNPGGDTAEIQLQLRGYVKADPGTERPNDSQDTEDDAEHATDAVAIAGHLYKTLRGRDNLVFANSRAFVEAHADILKRRCEQERVPNEFFPHHGNLSKEYREDVEARLRSTETPATAVCTSTLEMGIDIGSTDSVAQLGAPGSVAALRQRLGRSGRRDQPAVLRLYVSEHELTERTPPADQIHAELVQTVAMVDLMLRDRWYEPPNTSDLHLSTLTQQILSVIAQHGGATAAELYTTLCGAGPFSHVDTATFRALLTDLGTHKLLTQADDGLLLHGEVGDRIVNHYSFYTAFQTSEEYRLVANGRTLGSIPVDYPVLIGSLLIFAGRRWRVVDVDSRSRVIELTRSRGGRPPSFAGGGAEVADLVRQRMRQWYEGTEVPIYLNQPAQALLDEARDSYRRLRLQNRPVLDWGKDTLLFTWRGDRVLNTLAVALSGRGFKVGIDGVALHVNDTNPAEVLTEIRAMAAGPRPDPVTLAESVPNKLREKYDEYLSDALLARAYAAHSLDVDGAWDSLRSLAQYQPEDPDSDLRPGPANPAPVKVSMPAAAYPQLGVTPFAVIDLETTGFAAHADDRVVEIAIVHTDPTGRITGRWSTIVNPCRDPGPTQLHGITADDLIDAPYFTEVLDAVTEQLAGRIVVAHNAPYDLAFLTAEYERADETPPVWPVLCTLDLAGRLDTPGSHALEACCSEAGITLTGAHSALGDAEATAQLLACYLTRAAAAGLTDLGSLGCDASLPTAARPAGPPATAPALPRQHIRVPQFPAGSLAELSARAHPPASPDPGANSYLWALETAVRSGPLDGAAASRLVELAARWNLSAPQVTELHRRYLDALAAAEPNTQQHEALATLRAELTHLVAAHTG